MAQMVYFSNVVDPETGDVRCKRITLTFDPVVMGRYDRLPTPPRVPTDPTLTEFYLPYKEKRSDGDSPHSV